MGWTCAIPPADEVGVRGGDKSSARERVRWL